MLRGIIEKMYSPEEIFEFNLIYCDKITANVMEAIIHTEDAGFSISFY